jgi:hypothetical protein
MAHRAMMATRVRSATGALTASAHRPAVDFDRSQLRALHGAFAGDRPLAAGYSAQLGISLISRGAAEENRAKSTEHGLTSVLLQQDWEVAEAYQVNGTPSALLVSPDGTVGSTMAGGAEAIRALVAQAVGKGKRGELPMQPTAQGEPCPDCGKVHPNNGQDAQQAVLAGPKIGEPAPPLKLRDLKGKTVNLGRSR